MGYADSYRDAMDTVRKDFNLLDETSMYECVVRLFDAYIDLKNEKALYKSLENEKEKESCPKPEIKKQTAKKSKLKYQKLKKQTKQTETLK